MRSSTMPSFKTLDDVDVAGKLVLVRVDINVPYDEATGKIQDSERLRAHAKTLKELAEKGAKVVVLAHQGRKGDTDFIHLDQHASLLTEHIGRPVAFIEDVIGPAALAAVRRVKPGEILLLDNVRFLDDETVEKAPAEHAKSRIVAALSPLADLYVNDAFSAAHRAHASVVGFAATLPSVAGRVMERELTSCQKALHPERPEVLILGGAKPDDCMKIMEHMLRKGSVDKVLTCGILGQLLLAANGHPLGPPNEGLLEKKGHMSLVPQLRKIYLESRERIEIPLDVAEENGGRVERRVPDLPCRGLIMDIGEETIQRYRPIIRSAKTVIVKGPAGVYEKAGFEKGTKSLLEEVERAEAYTLIGGGDTSVAVEKLGFRPDRFSYVSVAGGALITYLSGKPMPGVEALEKPHE
ncbi:MAG: phosphoglycerate kinase [Candidatus Bathyarchaeia archaeon]